MQERAEQEDDGRDAGAVWQHGAERGPLLCRLLVPLPGAAHVQQGTHGSHVQSGMHTVLQRQHMHVAPSQEQSKTPSSEGIIA